MMDNLNKEELLKLIEEAENKISDGDLTKELKNG